MALLRTRASKLAAAPALLLAADPGPGLLAAARRYDPQLRRWPGRLVFGNGVLLFGPVEVTPKLTQQAGLPAGVALAWYAATAAQSHRGRRSHEEKIADGELLVSGLAAVLGGTLFPRPSLPPRALLASVYSAQPVAPDEVADVLRPYAGNDVAVEDASEDSYAISGHQAAFYAAYRSPRRPVAVLAPPPAAAGAGPGFLHHWDLNTGLAPSQVRPDLRLRVAEAALALAARAGGVAVDMYGFRFATASEMLPAPGS